MKGLSFKLDMWIESQAMLKNFPKDRFVGGVKEGGWGWGEGGFNF